MIEGEVDGHSAASRSKTCFQEQDGVLINDTEEILNNDENECLYNSPLSESSPQNIVFEADSAPFLCCKSVFAVDCSTRLIVCSSHQTRGRAAKIMRSLCER